LNHPIKTSPLTRSADLRLLSRVLREARPEWSPLLAVFLLGLAATPIALLAPVPVKIAVDSVIGSEPLPTFVQKLAPGWLQETATNRLILAIALLLGVALLTQLQWAWFWLWSTAIGERLVLRFRAKVFQHVQRLSLAFHDSRGSAETTYHIQYDAPAVRWILLDGLIPMANSALKLVGMIYVTLLIDPVIALVALGIAPVLLGLARFYRGHVRGQWRDVMEKESSAMSVVQEVVGSLRVVKAFGQEQREHERFVDEATRGVGARLRVVKWECLFGILVGLTTAAGTATVLYVGIDHVQRGILSLGELLLVMAYLAQLYEPLKSLSKTVTALQKSLASAERVFSLLDRVPDVVDRPHALPLRTARGAVACRNVHFAYETGHDVLKGVTFAVEPGRHVGIFGPTGAGKSTLVNLLTRLYDPTSGVVLLDGRDCREYRVADVRRQFAIVLQDPLLLSTSIAENIAYARPEATEEEIVAAAKAANAHDFISHLPDGYSTLVGERGMRLSGGERQRISIARAFLKSAPILILDEPTSSIDGRTEAGIMEAMERLMRGRTAFLIAHRLSTLRGCDLLLKIVDGELVEQSVDVAETLVAETQAWTPSVDAVPVHPLLEPGGT
jgi:ATP-binding cassette, subfamily B, bacterial